jgi:hypothetical protein
MKHMVCCWHSFWQSCSLVRRLQFTMAAHPERLFSGTNSIPITQLRWMTTFTHDMGWCDCQSCHWPVFLRRNWMVLHIWQVDELCYTRTEQQRDHVMGVVSPTTVLQLFSHCTWVPEQNAPKPANWAQNIFPITIVASTQSWLNHNLQQTVGNNISQSDSVSWQHESPVTSHHYWHIPLFKMKMLRKMSHRTWGHIKFYANHNGAHTDPLDP